MKTKSQEKTEGKVAHCMAQLHSLFEPKLSKSDSKMQQCVDFLASPKVEGKKNIKGAKHVCQSLEVLLDIAYELYRMPKAMQAQIQAISGGVIEMPLHKANQSKPDFQAIVLPHTLTVVERLNPFSIINTFCNQNPKKHWNSLLKVLIQDDAKEFYHIIALHATALIKLILACEVLHQKNNQSLAPHPASAFIDSINKAQYLSIDQLMEPVAFIYYLLSQKPLAHVKADCHHWMAYAQKEAPYPDAYELVKIFEHTAMLMDFAYMFANMQYIAAEWLQPHKWTGYNGPLADACTCHYEYLSAYEQQYPILALSARMDMELSYLHEDLRACLRAALHKKEVYEMESTFTLNILGIVEALHRFMVMVVGCERSSGA